MFSFDRGPVVVDSVKRVGDQLQVTGRIRYAESESIQSCEPESVQSCSFPASELTSLSTDWDKEMLCRDKLWKAFHNICE
jgi:hypothetical protein